MSKSQDSPGNPSGEPELAPADTSTVGREESGPSTVPAGTSPAQGSWDQRRKTWRRFTSNVSSARRADEQPPFSDD